MNIRGSVELLRRLLMSIIFKIKKLKILNANPFKMRLFEVKMYWETCISNEISFILSVFHWREIYSYLL